MTEPGDAPAPTPHRLTDTERTEQESDAERRPLGWPWRVLLFVGLLVLLAVWTYALWGPRSDPPGTMDDPAFGLAAEQVCAPTQEAVEALPLAHETRDPQERAAVVVEANALLAAKVAALAPLVELTPEDSEDRRRVTEWLADWDTHLEDRTAFAADLQTGDREARFTETEKGGRGISTALDEFARKNAMASCGTPGDVG